MGTTCTKNVGNFEAFGKSIYDKFNIDLNPLFAKKLSMRELNKYKAIHTLKILKLNESAYIHNLRNLPNLKMLHIKDVNIPEFFSELCNLKKIEHLDLYELVQKLSSDTYINNIVNCSNLTSLHLKLSIDSFPMKIIKLRQLSELVLYSSITNTITIPPEICTLDNLEYLEVGTNQNFIMHQHKMIIFKLAKEITIPDYIKELMIIDVADTEIINNLPFNVEILKIAFFNEPSITNLPFGLKKLIIFNNEVEYMDDITNEYITKKLTKDDIKIPHGCELVIKT